MNQFQEIFGLSARECAVALQLTVGKMLSNSAGGGKGIFGRNGGGLGGGRGFQLGGGEGGGEDGGGDGDGGLGDGGGGENGLYGRLVTSTGEDTDTTWTPSAALAVYAEEVSVARLALRSLMGWDEDGVIRATTTTLPDDTVRLICAAGISR